MRDVSDFDMQQTPLPGQSQAGIVNASTPIANSMDFFGRSSGVGSTSQMILPGSPLVNSIGHTPGLPVAHNTATTAAAAAATGAPMSCPSQAHRTGAPFTETAYLASKLTPELGAYPGYHGAFPTPGYPYSMPPAGYVGGGVPLGAMKQGYVAHEVAAAAAREEYYKRSMLPYGKAPMGPYGVGPSGFHPGYYPFPPMQGVHGAYPVQGVGSKRKLEGSTTEEAKRLKGGKSKPHKKKSKYRGVFWHSRGKAWVSSIMVNGKTTHLGYYDCEVEAARVYDKEAIRLKGITCAVNFPDSVERFGKNQDATTATDNKRSTRHERKRAERISKYRGVCWNKCNSSWKACIKIDGRNKHIGYFSSEKDAAKAYDLKARKVRGSSAKLNFPDEVN